MKHFNLILRYFKCHFAQITDDKMEILNVTDSANDNLRLRYRNMKWIYQLYDHFCSFKGKF